MASTNMQEPYPNRNDPKYMSGGSFNESLYQSDLTRWQASQGGSLVMPQGDETLGDLFGKSTDTGTPPAQAPGPTKGSSESGGYLRDMGPALGSTPTKVAKNVPNQPIPVSATPGSSTTPASSGQTSSPADDRTNDGGPGWNLGPAWKAIDDPELKWWSPEHQAAAQAAHDAHDETGFNGVKDYVRNERQTGGSNYRGGANAGYNPNNTPDSAYAGQSLKDILAQGGNEDYYGELSTFSQQDQDDWVKAYMRGATQQGQQIVDRARGNRK